MYEVNSLEAEILSQIREDRLHLNTFMPGNVLSYDSSSQTVDVRPALKRTITSPPSTKNRPDLFDIPVIFPRSSGNAIHIPLKAGDPIGLLFCQRSLDDWKDEGKLTKVTDVRLHDLSDAVAIAGLDINALTLPAPDKLSILSEDGIYIGNPVGKSGSTAGITNVELFEALSKLCDIISSLVLVTPNGPGSIAVSSQTLLSNIQAVFDEIGGNSSIGGN